MTAATPTPDDGWPTQAELDGRLFGAAFDGVPAAIDLLLFQGADPKAELSRALRLAAKNGHAECVALLLPISDPKALNSHALCLASFNGHAECVDLLLPFSDSEAAMPVALSWAAEAGHAECVKRLLSRESPSPENSLTANPRPLHLAIGAGRASVVALMLASEPSLAELVDFDQACSHAVALGRHELAATLLSFSESRSISASADVAAGSLRPMPSPRL